MSLLPLYARIFIVFFVVMSGSQAYASLPPASTEEQSTHPFAVPRGMESRVNFWKKVYTEYTTRQAIIHDIDDLNIIYEVVNLDTPGSRQSEGRLNSIKNKYRNILSELARKADHSSLTSEESRVAQMVTGHYYEAAQNIRVQIGQKNRFREGLIRSGLYMDKIRKIFREYGLPDELTALPHVESSFQIGAYSSAGAAGIWQFTRGTGRLFLRVGYEVDERRDPILATVAAAKLLKKNYEEVRSWPLAITAYNHGLGGMIRAKRMHGDDIVNIINKYDSRSFGFASSNFYAEFLAAMEVSRNYKRYFPDVEMPRPLQTVSVRFNEFVSMQTVKNYFRMTTEEVAEYNPALRPPVLSGQKRIPAGYIFKAPPEKLPAISSGYKSIPASLKYDEQIPSKWHTVGAGDTLSSIAAKYKTSVAQLKQLNNIGHDNRLQKGQVLQLPSALPKSVRPAVLLTTVEAVNEPEPATENDAPTAANAVVETKDKDLETLNSIEEQRNVVVKEKPVTHAVDNEPKGNEYVVYKVQKKETLSFIAKKFSSDIASLAELNQVKPPYALQIGQTLKVPKAPLVMQALKKSGDPEALGNKKFYLKAEQARNENEGKTKDESEENENVRIEFSKNEASAMNGRTINKNRPAFLPVLFSSKRGNPERSAGMITVDFDETLSHYADWAGVTVADILKANKFSPNIKIKINQKLKIPFTNKSPEEFTENRQEFHRAIQEDFYNNYRISRIVVRPIKKGETLYDICNGTYVVPFWLLSNYNPDKNIGRLSEGQSIVVPSITPLKPSDA